MDNKINFDFVSPEASIVSSEVDMVLIPGVDGDAGILPDHSPFMTTLRQGIVEVTFEQGNVKKYLVSRGIPSEKLTTQSKGESDPIVPNDTPENRNKNRRIEIIVN